MPLRTATVYRQRTGPVTLVAPTATPAAPLGPDSARLDAAQLVRIDRFRAELALVEHGTDELIAERTRRMAGAVVNGTAPKNIWYRIPVPASGCPSLGPLALSWQDIFTAAQTHLRALAVLRPPRFTAGDDVVRWIRAVHWNLILLLDATNIRPVFRWPADWDCARWRGTATADSVPGGVVSCAEYALGAHSTLATRLDDGDHEGMPYPGVNQTHGVGHPLAMQSRFPHVALQRPPVWWTGFDVPGTGVQLAKIADPLGQLPGPMPGNVIDADPARYGASSRPVPAVAIDRFWRDLAPQKVYYKNPVDLYELPLEWDVGAYLTEHVEVARIYSELDLSTMLFDSIGWYVNNHLPFWRSRGMIELDEATIATLQRQVSSAQMRQGLAPAQLIGTVASSVNPLAGAVIGLVTEIGFSLLDAFLGGALDHDIPRRLFVRSYPSSCIGIESDTDLTLEDEAAGIRAALGAREEEAALAAAELAAARDALAADREDREVAQATPWGMIAGGTVAVVALGLGLRAWLGGGRT